MQIIHNTNNCELMASIPSKLTVTTLGKSRKYDYFNSTKKPTIFLD